ncbi:D-arabinitol dehydrogenase 1 [Neolecta irregularis DAH-3]|uniref:D-arabinitol dehydrogenase 1 n=1 Tax=Neolecta irregularis (strain DAH-3) TaxID=1198029 RepID=A0A1U7LGY7_NEOID|nr:D-arabinitol dehydrogenase 1 [Neolecta irregularis DAH-3]|eukprot:OLL21812.1 D-arabinitol dehydrogenase 1 [Neolecta irregularis DAH-3]
MVRSLSPLFRFDLLETVGVVAAIGSDVKEFKIGDRVCADNAELCDECFYCRRGQPLLCENWSGHGTTLSGGFAEYCAYPSKNIFKIQNMSDIDATLLEPASCAAHGLEKIAPKLGSSVLMIGAGPTGLVLSQLLKQNGGCTVVIAANAGSKMDLARKLDAADVYIDLDRKHPEAQWKKLNEDHPHACTTGSAKILQDSINYVRRGGKLVVYAVYGNDVRVSWPPSKIFGDELTIIGSFSETFMFPTALNYLDSGKVRVEGIVNKTYKLEQWQECLDAIKSKVAIKAAIVFDD